MATKIFVNLPVKDLKRSIEFYKKLGFSINPQFSDKTGACVVISDNILVMLLTEPKFKWFIKKEIADTTKTTEAINAVSVESRKKVDEITQKAVAAGATIHRDLQDYGWMYG